MRLASARTLYTAQRAHYRSGTSHPHAFGLGNGPGVVCVVVGGLGGRSNRLHPRGWMLIKNSLSSPMLPLVGAPLLSALVLRPTVVPRGGPIVAAVRGLEYLPDAQQSAIERAFSDMDLPTLTTNSGADIWQRCRDKYPALENMSDEEITAAIDSYVSSPPKLWEVIAKTPVGPVVGINLALLAGVRFFVLEFIKCCNHSLQCVR